MPETTDDTTQPVYTEADGERHNRRANDKKSFADMTVREVIMYLLSRYGGKAGHLTSFSTMVLLILQMSGTAILPNIGADKEQIVESANTALDERLEGAEAMLARLADDGVSQQDSVTKVIKQAQDAIDRVDKKVDAEVGHVRESVADKVTALREAVVGLKDVMLEKLKYHDKCAKDAIDERIELKGLCKDLDARVRELESLAATLESSLPTFGATAGHE